MPWHRRPSSCRPPVNALSQKASNKLMTNFVERYLCTICPEQFFCFKNFGLLNFNELFSFSSTWDPMGVKNSKRYSSYSYNSFATKPFLHISCDSPHKTFQKIEKMFLNMGVKISKRYSSHSFDYFSTKLFLNFPCNNLHKTCFLEFWNFKIKLTKKDWNLTLCPKGKMQNCQYLGNSQPQSKTQWSLGLGGSLGSACTISGNWANGQVSWLNICPGVEREFMCNFWNFAQWPSFMPKYGKFENQPVSRKPLHIE